MGGRLGRFLGEQPNYHIAFAFHANPHGRVGEGSCQGKRKNERRKEQTCGHDQLYNV